jgi:hypothetical protein
MKKKAKPKFSVFLNDVEAFASLKNGFGAWSAAKGNVGQLPR